MDPKPLFYGWGYQAGPEDTLAMLEPWNGRLGAVLYRNAYPAAKHPGNFVAWMGSQKDVQAVADLANSGATFRGAIWLDEENGKTQANGQPLTGRQYVDQAKPIAATLKAAGVPFWGMSTRGIATGADYQFLRTERGLLDLPVTCWNPGGKREFITTALATKGLGPWFLSPHPFRFTLFPIDNCGAGGWFLDLIHGLTSGWYAGIAERPNVEAVAYWSLRAYGTGKFGLYNRAGHLTAVGRPPWRRAMGNRKYPTVSLKGA